MIQWPATAAGQLRTVAPHWQAGETDPAAIAARCDVATTEDVRRHLKTLELASQARRTATRGD